LLLCVRSKNSEAEQVSFPVQDNCDNSSSSEELDLKNVYYFSIVDLNAIGKSGMKEYFNVRVRYAIDMIFETVFQNAFKTPHIINCSKNILEQS